MLLELNIKNFAIIDQLNLSFGPGLNILSGETGAGKSIIIGALNLVLGGKATSELIRSSKEEAEVEALFNLGGKREFRNKLEGLGIKGEEELLIKRTVSRSGKGRVFINSSLANLYLLGELSRELCSISSQHEHQILLQPERQIDILDYFGGLLGLRDRVGEVYQQWLKLEEELNALILKEKNRKERKELLEFQAGEIFQAKLKEGEDEGLREEKKKLDNAEKLFNFSSLIYEEIYSSKGAAIENLSRSLSQLKEISQIDSSLDPLSKSLESVIFQLEDIAFSLRNYSQKISFDPKRLEEVESRLEEINRLKKKYGSTISEIILYKERIERELQEMETQKEKIEQLREELDSLKKKYLDFSLNLSQKRKSASSQLKSLIEKELVSLGMKKTIFRVELKKELKEEGSKEGIYLDGFKLSPKGIDEVEFLLSPNPGEELKPLSKIASGGELSRIILAIKQILAQEGASTLIFDEVDAGIGGGIAQVVGEKLRQISKNHQVICITHLPQIACFANLHYNISKKIQGGRTITTVKKLEKAERVEEIARMLGGLIITEKTREHAGEMIKLAENIDFI